MLMLIPEFPGTVLPDYIWRFENNNLITWAQKGAHFENVKYNINESQNYWGGSKPQKIP